MSRKRIIYSVLGAASNNGTIPAIQSMTYDFALPYQNVTEYGNLGIKDQIINGQPTINLNLNYLLNNIDNESKIGFSSSTNTLDNILNDNYSLNFTGFIGKEGFDLSDNKIEALIVFKSGYLTSYSARAGVGELMSINTTFSCNDLVFQSTSNASYNNLIPTGFSQPPTCDGNSLSLNINSIGIATGDFKIQNFDLNLSINRSPQILFGEKLARYQYINYPIDVTLNAEVIVGDYQNDTISSIVSNGRQLNLIIGTPFKTYEIGNCKLISQNFNTSIGQNETANLSFKSTLGGANDNLNYFRIT
jgi:hypothetical protein